MIYLYIQNVCIKAYCNRLCVDVLYKTGFGNCSTSFNISRRNAEQLLVIRSTNVDLCAKPNHRLNN